MIPSPRDVTAILLAGGRSRRFGRDKGLAAWRGRPLVLHAAAGLPDRRAATMLVVRPDQAADYLLAAPDLELVPDDPDLAAGPLRGVITGLRACATAWAWVVACDQPLVRPALLRGMLAVADDRPVVPVWGGRLQPVTALYPAAYAADLAAFAAGGERSLTRALVRAGHLELGEEACRGLDPDGRSFLNANSPEGLARIETLVKEAP